jgi:hypothetical protein
VAGRIISTKSSNDTVGNRTRDLPACSTNYATGVAEERLSMPLPECYIVQRAPNNICCFLPHDCHIFARITSPNAFWSEEVDDISSKCHETSLQKMATTKIRKYKIQIWRGGGVHLIDNSLNETLPANYLYTRTPLKW